MCAVSDGAPPARCQSHASAGAQPPHVGVSTEAIVQALQQHLAFLDEQIADLERQIHVYLDHFPHLKQQRDLLDTIPGLGNISIATLPGEVPNILAYKLAAQFTAYADVTPR